MNAAPEQTQRWTCSNRPTRRIVFGAEHYTYSCLEHIGAALREEHLATALITPASTMMLATTCGQSWNFTRKLVPS